MAVAKQKDIAEIILEGFGYNDTIDERAIDKSRLKDNVRNLEDLLLKREAAVNASIEQIRFCEEIADVEKQYKESLSYDFDGKINEISVMVSMLSRNQYVKNTLEVAEIKHLLTEYEAAKYIPERLKKKMDLMKKTMADEPDFKELEIQHVTYEIFASMGFDKRLDDTDIIARQISPDNLQTLEKEITSYVENYNGLVRKTTRTLLYSALESLEQMRTQDETGRYEAETSLVVTMMLIGHINPAEEKLKDAKKDLFYMQSTIKRMINKRFSHGTGFIDIYDKIPFNQGYISRVIETAKEVLKCKISPDK